MNAIPQVLLVVFLAICVLVVGGGSIYIEQMMLSLWPPQLVGNTQLETWLLGGLGIHSFSYWAWFIVFITITFALIWGTFCLLKDPRHLRQMNVIWWVLFLAPALFGFTGTFLQYILSPFHKIFVFFMYLWNATVPYYVATVLFTPLNFKFIPCLSRRIHKKRQ